MAGNGACSWRRGREFPSPHWFCTSLSLVAASSTAPLEERAFLWEADIAEFLTHAWAESSLGLWTTVTK